MSCYNQKKCSCGFNIKTYGLCDTTRITINGADRTALNWSEISVPEILCVPIQKPDIENIDQVYVNTDLTSVKLIETPLAYNQYDILATAAQITEITTVLNTIPALVTTLNTIVTDLTAVLNVVGLPAIPEVTALETLLSSLTTAVSTLSSATANALDLIVAPVTINVICAALSAIIAAIELVEALLGELTPALNALVAAVAGIPIVGDAVEALVTPLLTLIGTTLTTVTSTLASVLALTSICAQGTVIVIKSNAEGTCLSGRKLVIEGLLNQKIVYTANVDTQSVHSAHYNMPFSAFIVPYANFENGTYLTNVPVLIDGVATTVNGFVFPVGETPVPNLCEEFCVTACIEDIFAYALDLRTIFKNVTLFLLAKPSSVC